MYIIAMYSLWESTLFPERARHYIPGSHTNQKIFGNEINV